MDFGRIRGFINCVNTGEIFQFTRAGFFIQPLRIALLADLQRGIDEDFNKAVLADALAHELPLNGIGLVDLTFDEPLVLDPYQQNPVTGGLIFIDRLTNVTVGAGMVREPNEQANLASEFSAFELELNALVRKHFPHWGARDLLGGK